MKLTTEQIQELIKITQQMINDKMEPIVILGLSYHNKEYEIKQGIVYVDQGNFMLFDKVHNVLFCLNNVISVDLLKAPDSISSRLSTDKLSSTLFLDIISSRRSSDCSDKTMVASQPLIASINTSHSQDAPLGRRSTEPDSIPETSCPRLYVETTRARQQPELCTNIMGLFNKLCAIVSKYNEVGLYSLIANEIELATVLASLDSDEACSLDYLIVQHAKSNPLIAHRINRLIDMAVGIKNVKLKTVTNPISSIVLPPLPSTGRQAPKK